MLPNPILVSDEDMRKCYAQGIADSNEYMFLDKSGREFFEDYIQSLSKPKEYNVQYVQEGNTIKNN